MQDLNTFDRKKIKNNLKHKIKSDFELKIYEEVDSTNKKAKDYLQKNNLEKNIIFTTKRQTAGKGRKGHSWFSNDPASLAVSFLFEINYNLKEIPQITAAAALAVSKTFKKFGLKTQVKWPNDILAANKKICGILSELVFNKDQEAFVIIGCGINLNNNNFKEEIKEIATSYYLETKNKLDKNLFLAELILNMDYYLNSYLNADKKTIITEWKNELDLADKRVDLEYKGCKYRVLIKKVLNTGELLVVFADGKEKKLQSLYTSLDYKSLAT